MAAGQLACYKNIDSRSLVTGMIGLSVRFGESLQRLTYANGATYVVPFRSQWQ